MVAITSINSRFLPLNSRKEKENAASEQDTICPAVIQPATKNEFTIKRVKGILTIA